MKYLRKMDCLSDQILIRFQNEKGYRNASGGILYILILIFTLITCIYLLMEKIINKKEPKSISYIDNKEDGLVKISSREMFHAFALIDLSGQPVDLNQDYFEILGTLITFDKRVLAEYRYSLCKTEDFNNLNIKLDQILYKYYCMRKMTFNSQSKSQTEIDINDKTDSFIIPYINVPNPFMTNKNTYYKISIYKCSQKSKSNCRSESELKDFFSDKTFHLLIKDNIIRIEDYNNPINPYFRSIKSLIKSDYTTNIYVNYNTVDFSSHIGLVFDSEKSLKSFKYNFHSEIFNEIEAENLIHKTEFYVLNTCENYKRWYPSLQLVAAEIGGIYQFLCLCARLINLIFDSYTNHIINLNFFKKFKLKNLQNKETIIPTEKECINQINENIIKEDIHNEKISNNNDCEKKVKI